MRLLRTIAPSVVMMFVLCVGGGSLAQSSVAIAPPIYDDLIDGAVDAFARGEWASARLLFERAAAVRPNARPLRGMGMADFNMRAYARATEELEAALAAPVQPLDEPLRLQVAELLLRAGGSVARVEVRLQPPESTLQIDGQAPSRDARGRLLVDLGRHSLHIEAPRYAPHDEVRTFERAGEQVMRFPALAPLSVAEVREPRRKSSSVIWRRTLTAAGAGALVASLGTELRAAGRFADTGRRCRERAGCLPDEIDLTPVHRLDRASAASLSVGAALVVAAFVLWLSDLRR